MSRTSARPAQAPRSPVPAAQRTRQSRGVAGALIGVLAGMYAGATVGWALTKNCACDDPGMGAVIGFPIGGVIGGVLGYNLLK